jgi:hypothetical protein
MSLKRNSNILLTMIAVLVLLYPAMKGIFGFVKEAKLDGAVVYKENVPFSVSGWWDGSWQLKKEEYLNEQFGGRNFFVRLQHELDFRLFRKGHAKDLVIGRENYLFERNYIQTYFGKDYLGEDVLSGILDKVKKSQDILASYGKTQLLVLAPGKGSFYPEYFPCEYDSFKRGPTNYESMIRLAVDKNIHFIDFSTYMRSQKSKSTFSLYPKYGVHWSIYAMAIAQDSITRYIEHKRGIRIPHLVWKDVSIKNAHDIDYDIASGMNLLSYLNGPKMAYPNVYIDSTGATSRTSLLVISDSFYQGIFNMGYSDLFDKSHFWYYYNEVYPENFTAPTTIANVNFIDQIAQHDVIMLMATEQNLPGVGWGFVDDVINKMQPADSVIGLR